MSGPDYGQMRRRCERWIRDVHATPLPASAVKLAQRASELAWHTAEYFESTANAAAATGMSERSVRRARQRLLEVGLFALVKRGGRGVGDSARFRMRWNGAADARTDGDLASHLEALRGKTAPMITELRGENQRAKGGRLPASKGDRAVREGGQGCPVRGTRLSPNSVETISNRGAEGARKAPAPLEGEEVLPPRTRIAKVRHLDPLELLGRIVREGA